jgi:sirohydrochlorin cobaltochelatase
MALAEHSALEELDARLRTLLPEEYQDSYEDVQPAPMRSAGLKYAADGRVAWNEIWQTFCDLAMAGGPPHRGSLLAPGRRIEIDAQADAYDRVSREICRGVTMVTDLPAEPSPTPGWVRVACEGTAMAGWLARAIVMENVTARCDGDLLDLPAAPHFRLEREIKNVVTVIAKTCHYWVGHIPRVQQRAIASLLTEIAAESRLVQPAAAAEDAGWRGVECASVSAAIWMMRAMVVTNVFARREGTVLFVPVNPALDPGGATAAAAVARVQRLAAARGIG